MAYAVKYLFKFQSCNGTVREIRVLQDGYSGSVIQRPLGRAPVIKKEQNGGVHGTSLTFYAECHIDREYIEFYTSDPKEYRVDVYAGSTLLWQGYITPELYSEPDIAPPYDVQVVATDGVGELKLYDFTPQGTVTLRSLLTYLLGHTGLSTDVNLISSLKPGSHGAGALLDMQICVDYLAGKTCYEALTYILDTLHATITRWGGAWLLVRETNVTFTGDKVRYFNTSGNSALLAGSVQTLGAMRSAPAWPVGQLSTVIDPAKNKVVVQAPWHPVTCLANPDMMSDTGWAKANNASYGPDGYLLPNNDTGGSTYATAHISQALSLAGMRTPMSFELRATGVAAQVGARVGAVIGVLLTYTVGSTVYLLRKGDEGTPVWKQGSAPGSSIDGRLVDYQQPLASFDADRIQAETLRIDEIPAFVQGTSYPSGTLTVYVVGSCARVYGAHLDVVLPKGYQDILRIDNGARGEGDSVEIAIGRQTADVAYYQAFLQGLLLDSGSLITAFSDANFTTAMDYLALISRDYALSAALPRALAKGTVYLESSIGMPPLVFAKGGLNYWLETWSWDLYEDELKIDARTLPSASLTVQSETILESDGSTVSSSSSGASGGGSSISPGGGTNYFQIDEDLQTLLAPKPQFDFLSPKKGLIFGTTEETDVASSPAHLMLRNLGTAQSPNYALYTPYALITGGDQIVGSGTPGGGGGGGASYLGELRDVEFGLSPSVGQILVYAANVPLNPDGTQYGPGWTVANMPSGDVTSVSVNGQTYTPVGGVVTLPNYPTIPSTYAWSAITGTPTTLGSGGYGITDAKIENGVITLGSNSITPLTSHQTIYGLTLKVGTSTVGSYTPNSSAQILTVTAQNLYDTIGSAKYHPYGGDTSSNTFKIGGATLTWHPESSVGAGDAYLEIDSALLTLGDQIVMSGTPGGGGGGAGYLYELGDIYHDTDKTKVLRTDGTTPAAVGDVLQLTSLTGGNKWAAVPATDIGRVYSGGTGITIDGNTISLTSGVATTGTYRSVTVDTYGRVTAGTNPTTLSGYGITDAVPSSRTVNSKALSSNITLSLDDVADGSTRSLANYLPLAGGTMSNTNVVNNLNADLLDGQHGSYYNNLLAFYDSGATSADSVTYPLSLLNVGTPSSAWYYVSTMYYGSVGSNTLSQIAINYIGDEPNMYIRKKYNSWTSWRVLYHSGNLTKSVLTGLLDASGGYYLPLSAGTSQALTGNLNFAEGAIMRWAPTTAMSAERFLGPRSSYSYDLSWYNGTGWTLVYHSGNSNKSDVAWACSTLTASTSVISPNLYAKSDTYPGLLFSDSTQDRWIFSKRSTQNHLHLIRYTSSQAYDTVIACDYTNGYVGIGTASPEYKLDVKGEVYVNDYIRIGRGGTTIDSRTRAGATEKLHLQYYESGDLSLCRGGGNVGIGTDSPGYNLHINYGTAPNIAIGNTASCLNPVLRFLHNYGSTAYTYFVQGYNGLLMIGGGSAANAININSSYNVGIGTGSPSQKCHISGGLLAITNNSNTVTIGSANTSWCHFTSSLPFWFGNNISVNGHVLPYAPASDALGSSTAKWKAVYASDVESDNGYGMKSTGDYTYGLSLYGSYGNWLNYGMGFHLTGNGGKHGSVQGDWAVYLFCAGATNRGWIFKNGSTAVASLSAGGIFTTNGDQVISSDERLKTIVKPVDMTVEQLAGMRAVIYDRKDSGVRSLGVIAQDWEKVLPESVNQGEYLTFKYAQTAMVSAIVLAKHETEQDKEIRELKAKVADQNREILRLKARLNMN